MASLAGDKFASGWYNLVFKVAFEDGILWIALIRCVPEVDEDYNITAVIDWTCTYIVLIETFCFMPLEFTRFNPSASKEDNLLWRLMEEWEGEMDPLTPLSNYVKSAEHRTMVCFDFGHFRQERIMKQYNGVLSMSYEQVVKMYRDCILLEASKELRWHRLIICRKKVFMFIHISTKISIPRYNTWNIIKSFHFIYFLHR